MPDGRVHLSGKWTLPLLPCGPILEDHVHSDEHAVCVPSAASDGPTLDRSPCEMRSVPRLYFGFFLSDAMNDAIDNELESWPTRAASPMPDDVAWVPRRWRHITLLFLGDRQDTEQVAERAEQLLSGFDEFIVSVRAFPALLHGGAIALPTQGGEVVAEVLRSSFPEPGRAPFFGHVTIGWTKTGVSWPSTRNEDRSLPCRWTVGAIDLVQSHPHSEINRYEVVRRFSLSGRATSEVLLPDADQPG